MRGLPRRVGAAPRPDSGRRRALWHRTNVRSWRRRWQDPRISSFLAFVSDPTRWKLWIRPQSRGNNWANDSVFVQFVGAVDAAGNPIYQFGTTSALAVNLEECTGCGDSGWGVARRGLGCEGDRGQRPGFSNPDGHDAVIWIQTREDGDDDQSIVRCRRTITRRGGREPRRTAP